MTTIPIKCVRHPRYQGIHRPRVECFACNDVYHFKQSGGIVCFGIHEMIAANKWPEHRLTIPKAFRP